MTGRVAGRAWVLGWAEAPVSRFPSFLWTQGPKDRSPELWKPLRPGGEACRVEGVRGRELRGRERAACDVAETSRLRNFQFSVSRCWLPTWSRKA